jgi:hypothetical protein
MVTKLDGCWEETTTASFHKEMFWQQAKADTPLKQEQWSILRPAKGDYTVLNNTPTIFVKVNKLKFSLIEGVWSGEVTDFSTLIENVSFKATIGKKLGGDKWPKINGRLGCFIFEDNGQPQNLILPKLIKKQTVRLGSKTTTPAPN